MLDEKQLSEAVRAVRFSIDDGHADGQFDLILSHVASLTRELEAMRRTEAEAIDFQVGSFKEDALEALEPFANAANTLDMDGIEGFPFDDPSEVLWAGEGGFITVADFRRAQALVTRLSRETQD